MQAILFRIVPTTLEISLVCGILASTLPRSGHKFFRLSVKGRRISLVGTLRPLPPLPSLRILGLRSVQPHGGAFNFLLLISSHQLRHLRRTRFRREANQADNKAATIAVDSLINFEAVKVQPL